MGNATRQALVFFIVVLFSLVLKLCVLDIRQVSGPSMLPTLPSGSLVVEFKLAWGIPVPFTNTYLIRWGEPQNGDIVFYPWNSRYVIKRCIARAGTPLVFSENPEYSVRIGSKTVLLTGENYQKMKDVERVPDGMIFALGDNMAESRDSRYYGFVSIDSIRGKLVWK